MSFPASVTLAAAAVSAITASYTLVYLPSLNTPHTSIEGVPPRRAFNLGPRPRWRNGSR